MTYSLLFLSRSLSFSSRFFLHFHFIRFASKTILHRHSYYITYCFSKPYPTVLRTAWCESWASLERKSYSNSIKLHIYTILCTSIKIGFSVAINCTFASCTHRFRNFVCAEDVGTREWRNIFGLHHIQHRFMLNFRIVPSPEERQAEEGSKKKTITTNKGKELLYACIGPNWIIIVINSLGSAANHWISLSVSDKIWLHSIFAKSWIINRPTCRDCYADALYRHSVQFTQKEALKRLWTTTKSCNEDYTKGKHRSKKQWIEMRKK